MVPRLIDHYRARVTQLPELMQKEPAAAREALGELFGEIELGLRTGVRLGSASMRYVLQNVVAGVGFEPTTFGL